jgi:hypothetical protein
VSAWQHRAQDCCCCKQQRARYAERSGLAQCGALLLADGERALGGGGLNSWAVDVTLTLLNLTLSAIYLRAATREVYATRGTTGAMQTIALALASMALVPAYRFTIFVITLYLT